MGPVAPAAERPILGTCLGLAGAVLLLAGGVLAGRGTPLPHRGSLHGRA